MVFFIVRVHATLLNVIFDVWNLFCRHAIENIVAVVSHKSARHLVG